MTAGGNVLAEMLQRYQQLEAEIAAEREKVRIVAMRRRKKGAALYVEWPDGFGHVFDSAQLRRFAEAEQE